ncbi:biogenesis of lysosome-related organelles complex 1 subunit 3-like [Patiria miniata]|uniref:Biogenesis of lysosome-related organelles complex 1 subunit 3 n=1 Tax=Patiria miniata TaxID=46514 RepID=A0A914BD77_PATMI|nr:biogenesis of lysosome-related organelles complex 1 subunit 3-like [Patiria miniata]
MSKIVSVVSGEAEESDTDEEVSSNGDEGTTNDDTTDSAGGGETNAGLRPSKPPRPRPLRTLSAQPGVIVQGEASETDSDEDTSMKPKRSVSDPIRHEGLPPLKVEFSSRKKDHSLQFPKSDQHDKPSSQKELPALKYDTLLHRKLRERNACLQTALYGAVASVFHTSAKELAEANQLLGKSQTVIQDVCHNLRVFTTDLKQIEEKLDAVNSCANIPNICIDKRGT